MQTYEISLDMKKAPGRIERTVVVRRGDADTQTIEAAITAGGQPYTPRGAARLDIMHADGTWARCTATLSGPTASCTMPNAALNGPGRCRAAHFVFTDGEKVESTEGFALVIEDNVDANGTPGAQGYDSELEALKDAWRKFTERAERDEAARAEAEGRRAAAEAGRESAETARAGAETKRAAAEGERAKAETARADAEMARKAAETKRAQAETVRETAEAKRGEAETARKVEESKRAEAETGRKRAETARADAEGKRATAETARAAAETARATAEDARKAAETARVAAETARGTAEGERVKAEQARATAEQGRASKEAERVAAEAARAEAEKARVSAESSRSTAETARSEAERARADAQAKNNADQALNNEAMKKLSPVILQAGQYDPSTLTPTVTGEPNRMYFVPMVAPAAIELYDLTPRQVEAGNLYVEWMWVGGKWEQMGQSEMKAKPITTDQVDAVFAGTHPTGDSVLNLTGLDYVRTKEAALLDGKADASHTHTAGDIASGTLDPARVPVLPTAKVDGLQGALDGKAAAAHRHPTADVDGLQAALDGKQPRGEYAASSHTHAVADVDGLQAALDGKAAASHRHAAADIDGLDAAAGGVKVVRTDKDYPDGHDKDGFYVTLKDDTDPLYPAYYAPQAIVLFASGLAMWKAGNISSTGAIYLAEAVSGCTARFECSGSGSQGNGGLLEVRDGGLLSQYISCCEATIDAVTIDGHVYENVPLSGYGSGPLEVFMEQNESPQDWWAMTLRLPNTPTGGGTGVTSLATEQAESGVYGVCYGERGELTRQWEADSRLRVRFVREC